jgi:hypothetical protein
MTTEPVTYDCRGDEPVKIDSHTSTTNTYLFNQPVYKMGERIEYYLLYVNSRRPVAEIRGSLGGEQNKIRIQVDKKLIFRQRLICWFLGLKYIKYEIL